MSLEPIFCLVSVLCFNKLRVKLQLIRADQPLNRISKGNKINIMKTKNGLMPINTIKVAIIETEKLRKYVGYYIIIMEIKPNNQKRTTL